MSEVVETFEGDNLNINTEESDQNQIQCLLEEMVSSVVTTEENCRQLLQENKRLQQLNENLIQENNYYKDVLQKTKILVEAVQEVIKLVVPGDTEIDFSDDDSDDDSNDDDV